MLSSLVQRRIRQLKRVYEQARDVDVLFEFLQAENRAYVRGMMARQETHPLDQEMRREGDRVYVDVPPAFCQRRASYLKSLCEGVLGRAVDVEPVPGLGPCGACRIALDLAHKVPGT